MAKSKTPNGEKSQRISRFDPKARKEVTDSELKALKKTNPAGYYFHMGEDHRIQGELKQAISCYKKVLQINPEHENSLFFIGYCYLPTFIGYCYLPTAEKASDSLEPNKTAQVKKAASAFEKLIGVREKKNSICRDDYLVYYNLGQAQCNLHLYEKAIKSFRHAVELNSDDADSYYMLGFAQSQLGLHDKTIESLEQAIKIRSDWAWACRILGMVYHRLVVCQNCICG